MKNQTRPIPASGRRAARRVESRRRLIAATIESLCRVGYYDTTTVSVADWAGLSRGALQHHFKSRDDLFLAVVEHVGNELAGAFRFGRTAGSSSQPGDGIERRVDHICRTYWHVYRSNGYRAQLQIWIGAVNDAKLQGDIRKLARQMARSQDALWQASFADANLPPIVLSNLKGVTLSCIRGLALRPAHKADARIPPELRMLVKMVARVLRDGG